MDPRIVTSLLLIPAAIAGCIDDARKRQRDGIDAPTPLAVTHRSSRRHRSHLRPPP